MSPRHRKDMCGFVLISCFYLKSCISIDTIQTTRHVQDPESLKSAGGVYTLGFFSPNGSRSRYVGLWYTNYPPYAASWVANREKPILDSSGIMAISADGNLIVKNGKEGILWSSNVASPVTNATAKLLDTGNLVLVDANGNTIWESFDHMSDSFLPKMKLSTNEETKMKSTLTSWKTPSDPSIGSFILSLDDIQKLPELFIRYGTRPYWRSGPWNSHTFIGIQDVYSVYLDGFTLIDDKEGSVSLTYSFEDKVSYFFLDSQGKLVQTSWDDEMKNWKNVWSSKVTECDVYGKCGPFAVCDSKKLPICSCLKGFKPRVVDEWNQGNWTSGCVRTTPLNCHGNDGFFKMETTKVPDFPYWADFVGGPCSDQCLKNCSCIAYAPNTGIGCLFWSEALLDLQKFSAGGTDFYIRLAHSDLAKARDYKLTIGIIAITTGAILIFISAYCIWMRVKKQRVRKSMGISSFGIGKNFPSLPRNDSLGKNINQVKFQELLVLSFEDLVIATNNFSLANKLGEGGFGPVYKGKLSQGQDIAVKRLSGASGQGLVEFMNEMEVMSKVQHRNVVRLLGCCVEGDEKMLIYELVPNKSLDTFLFDPVKRKELDWRKRFNIIDGICRGLLYLHRDSRLRIVHRDLKVSNILLDEELHPKISDFGMARIFIRNEDQANTRRVVGTIGYMAPEYAIYGRFSEKSDVFSFGVLMLEIISGRKNTSFNTDENNLSLLEFAWKLWNEKNIVAFIDPTIAHEGSLAEILRCINVGLLCVQEFVKDRPTMSTVISMINSKIANLPNPRQPAFCERKINSNSGSSTQSQMTHSRNSITITAIEGR